MELQPSAEGWLKVRRSSSRCKAAASNKDILGKQNSGLLEEKRSRLLQR
jgi:hypothetical protein